MHAALLLFLAPLALGASTSMTKRQTPYANTTLPEPSLPGFLYINGELAIIDGEVMGSSTKLCDPNVDDVLTCALNKRASLVDPDDSGRTDIVAALPVNNNGDFFKLDYSAFLRKCAVSQPELISKDGFVSCGIDSKSTSMLSPVWSATDCTPQPARKNSPGPR
jgi:hypothetical protein